MNPLLLKYLETAADASWSGSLQVLTGEEACGHVIFIDGRVAWAVSCAQREDLGTFLWRLGFVTRTQLGVVRNIYAAYEGSRRLGAILEQCGFLSRSALRRALVLHTRAAIDSLGRLEDARFVQVSGPMGEDEESVFDLQEVLPEREAVELGSTRTEPDSWRFWTHRGTENDILSPLAALRGYRAAIVCAADGSLLTAHVAGGRADPLRMGVLLGSVFDAAQRDPPADDLDATRHVCVEYAGGCTIARVLGETGFLLATLVGETGDHDEARDALAAAEPDVEAWTREYASPDRFRRLLKGLVKEADDDEATLNAIRIAVTERLRLARVRREPRTTVELFERAIEMLDRRTLRGAIAVIEGTGASTDDP